MAPSPTTLLEDAKGRSTTSILRQGVGAWLLTVSTSAILGLQAVVELMVLTPVDIVTDIMRGVAEGLILGPLGLVETGAETSSQALGQFEIFGFPLSVVLFLSGLFIVGLYLRERETSDLFPGTFTDFIGGTEEEANAED
jgi:hypothetical protein